MDYKTFDEWSKAGYKILKGSKATWIDGVPMFSKKQVVKRARCWPSVYDGDYYDDYQDAMDIGDFY